MSRFFSLAHWLGVLAAFFLLTLVHASLFAQTTGRFYYYDGTRIPLNLNPRLVAVRFAATAPLDIQRAITGAEGDVENFDAGLQAPTIGVTFLPLRAGSDPITAAARFNARSGVQFASPVYDFGTTQLAETDIFLAKFKSALSGSDIAAQNLAHDVAIVQLLPNSADVYELKPNATNARSAREMANAYVEAGIVDFAEPDFVVRQVQSQEQHTTQAQESGVTTPNDPNFHLQWGLKNTDQFLGAVAGDDIRAPQAWGVTQGSSGIKIAIIDEGVDATHPDLAGKVLSGYNSLDHSSNSSPNPNDYHGSAVAGVAAANTNTYNPIGIAGTCWQCKILPVKVAERDSQGNWTATIDSLASGINWAWQHGADVLSNSWTMNAPNGSISSALAQARFGGRGGMGSTIVFASGNENVGTVSFPASLNSYVIAVGASNWCDERKTASNTSCNNGDAGWGSNYGTPLDLVAPGEAIYTTCNGSACLYNIQNQGAYTYLSGTSLSVPFVAGVAGLLYSLNPNLTPDQVQQALQNGAQDIGAAGRDNETGYGRLDAYRSIAALYNLKIKVTGAATLVRPGDTIAYALSYSNNGVSPMSATHINAVLPANTSYVSSTPAFTAQSGGNYLLSLGPLASNASGTATFRVKVKPAGAGQSITFNASIGGAYPESNSSDNTVTDKSFGIQTQFFLPLLERNFSP